MRRAIWFACAALVCGAFARDARAQWPRINPKLKTGQIAIHAVLVLPAQVEYQIASLKDVHAGTQQADKVSASLYSAVCKELSLRGVSILKNAAEDAKTDAERYAMADLQSRYDTVAIQMRRKPGLVDRGNITLDDRVARFAAGAGSDALVFMRANGVNRRPFGSLKYGSGLVEVTFVDAKSGEVLALIRFSLMRDLTINTDERLTRGFREALHDVPLPLPPPKK